MMMQGKHYNKQRTHHAVGVARGQLASNKEEEEEEEEQEVEDKKRKRKKGKG